ncbi:MAG: ferritin [Synergistaceae bacterium]|nr:ferritin [Synergistota bacterium]NLM71865.1 ferritin [Synergistaceae bacterium]
MINRKVEEAINEQINAELYSAYIYLSMASWFDSMNLGGMAHWMNLQAKEEVEHALKFADFLMERGGRVIYKAIEGPETEWPSPLEAFRAAYDHEKYVTRRINDLMDIAIAEKDYASQVFLQWFITEQVEEEASASEIVGRLEMIGDGKHGLLMIDKELAGREDD